MSSSFSFVSIKSIVVCVMGRDVLSVLKQDTESAAAALLLTQHSELPAGGPPKGEFLCKNQ